MIDKFISRQKELLSLPLDDNFFRELKKFNDWRNSIIVRTDSRGTWFLCSYYNNCDDWGIWYSPINPLTYPYDE